MTKKHRKRKSKLAALALAVLMLGSAVPAYAQTATVEEQEIAVDLNESQPTNLLDEYTEQLSSSEVEGSILYDDESLIAPLATAKTFSWPLPANTRMSSAGFESSSGRIIHVDIVSTSGYTVKVGIIDPDNIWRYVNITNSGSHDFSLTKDGTYHLSIRNDNDVRITVTGGYAY